MNQLHERIRSFQKHMSQLKELGTLRLPPPSFEELRIEYFKVELNRLSAKVPFQERFTNPMGLYQGGFLAACIDEVFGPLSYLAAQRPCMTLSMNLTYLKAFTPQMGHCEIEAIILKQTSSFIFMRAEVKSIEGELLAHAESHVAILRDDQLKKGKV